MIYPSSNQLPRVIPADFAVALCSWKTDGLETVFRAIWNGYSDLLADPDVDLNWNNENQITQRMVRRIRGKFWPKACAFSIETQSGIEETRKSARGLPPTPDVTICSLASQQISELHIEAKIIRDDSDTAPYLAEISGNFCTGRYCPRSSVGGLFAYHQADASTFPSKTGITLTRVQKFSPNLHFESTHVRAGLYVKVSATNIKLHHFIMPIPAS